MKAPPPAYTVSPAVQAIVDQGLLSGPQLEAIVYANARFDGPRLEDGGVQLTSMGPGVQSGHAQCSNDMLALQRQKLWCMQLRSAPVNPVSHSQLTGNDALHAPARP